MLKLKTISAIVPLCAACVHVGVAGDLITSHNDLARTSLNADELALNPSNVNVASFGKIRTLPADGQVYAQPLYLSSVPIYDANNVYQGRHNVIIVGTEKDSFYAYDADTGAKLWSRSLIPSGETTVAPLNTKDRGFCGDVTFTYGITSTPVVDLDAGPHGRVFVAAYTQQSSSVYHERVYAIDLSTGKDAMPPGEANATFPGTGPNNDGKGHVVFDPRLTWTRPGLVLVNKKIYTFYGSHCDSELDVNGKPVGYTAFMIAFDEGTLAQAAVGNLNPNGGPATPYLKYGSGATVWQSGGAPAVDAAGDLYVVTGNGPFNPANGGYGDSFVKLATVNGTISAVDYFTPYNQATLGDNDGDYGSGSTLAIPDQIDATGKVRHLATGNGKDGNLFVVDRDNLGKYNAGGKDNHNVYQEIVGGLSGGVWSSPAYFNGSLYFGPSGGRVRRFVFKSAKLDPVPDSTSPTTYGYPGTSPTVSAYGTTNGIVWAYERKTNANNAPVTAILHAYDATDLTRELWSSSQNATRDGMDVPVKFITPTVSNGKVLTGTATTVTEFGLLHPVAAQNVTSKVRLTRSGFSYLRGSGHYQQTVMINNAGTSALTGPLSLVLDGLASAAYLANRTGGTTVAAPAASPYVNVALSAPLAPGQSVAIRLEFITPSAASVTYTARVLGGSGSR